MSKTAKETLLSLPTRFNPESVDPTASTLFHFKISGNNGGEFTASIHDRKCEVTEGLTGEPKCTVSATDQVFEDVISGKQNPQMAVLMGKLKISNLGEMLKYAKTFGLM